MKVMLEMEEKQEIEKFKIESRSSVNQNISYSFLP